MKFPAGGTTRAKTNAITPKGLYQSVDSAAASGLVMNVPSDDEEKQEYVLARLYRSRGRGAFASAHG